MTTDPTRKLKVFLCHSSNDKPAVREIYARLKAEGWIDPWLDEEKLFPGQDWDLEIEKAVEETDAVLVFLSDNSVSKEGYIQKEIRFVLNMAEYKPEGTLFILPLRLNECPLPRRLRSWHYVDNFPEERKEWAYERLLGSLKMRANKVGVNVDNFLKEKVEKWEQAIAEQALQQQADAELYRKEAREALEEIEQERIAEERQILKEKMQKEEQMAELLRKANIAIRKGDWLLAKKKLQEILEIDGEHTEARVSLLFVEKELDEKDRIFREKREAEEKARLDKETEEERERRTVAEQTLKELDDVAGTIPADDSEVEFDEAQDEDVLPPAIMLAWQEALDSDEVLDDTNNNLAQKKDKQKKTQEKKGEIKVPRDRAYPEALEISWRDALHASGQGVEYYADEENSSEDDVPKEHLSEDSVLENDNYSNSLFKIVSVVLILVILLPFVVMLLMNIW